MSKAINRRQVVRSSFSSWSEDENMHDRATNRYSWCVTLDPDLADSAWDRLSEDGFALEITQLPAFLHAGFMREVRKRVKHGG